MGGGSPCKDPSAQFCNVIVTVASKRGRGAPSGAKARQEHAAPLGISKPANRKDVRNMVSRAEEIGRAHVWTPVTNANLVCRLLLEKKTQTHTSTDTHSYISPTTP